MTDPTQYARWFRDSTPYISTHRRKTFVILLGGDAIVHDNITHIVHDLALLSVLGVRVVLVHGARPQIDAAVAAAGLTPQFHDHRRITDQATIEQVESAVARVRVRIEGLFSMGLPNTPLHNTKIHVLSGNLVTARPFGVVDGIDHLFTGRVRPHPQRAHPSDAERPLHRLAVAARLFAVRRSVQSLERGARNRRCHRARRRQADHVRLGIRGHRRNRRTAVRSVAERTRFAARHRELRRHTRLRLTELLRACRAGVPRTHLIGFRDDGALLQELYTAAGCGTQISEDGFQHIRRATAEDVAGIVELIRPLENAGVLVRRPRDRLEREIDRFFVAELDGNIIGCCALYPFEEARAGELACLATHPSYRLDAKEHGTALVRRIETEARRLGLDQLFLLTTQTRDWFKEQGFVDATVDELPAPRKAVYNFQRNSAVMLKRISKTV
jgi:amino-acid N-acetyltransferase